MKRFRDENGCLTMPLSEVEKATFQEAMDYYRAGHIYLNMADNEEYVMLLATQGDGELAHFQSFNNKDRFIPFNSLGTFLPGVASEGMELIKVE